MCESYSRSLLRVSVAQICQALGWDSVQVTACDLLTDVLHRYLQQLCRGAHRYSELYGRTDPVLDDVGQAFKLMGVNLHELEDYIHNIEPVTFPHQIPSFPVSKNNVLQFPPPGSKDVEDRKEYIPDYLPLIISSQEAYGPNGAWQSQIYVCLNIHYSNLHRTHIAHLHSALKLQHQEGKVVELWK